VHLTSESIDNNHTAFFSIQTNKIISLAQIFFMKCTDHYLCEMDAHFYVCVCGTGKDVRIASIVYYQQKFDGLNKPLSPSQT
jgi:hypothetical protein